MFVNPSSMRRPMMRPQFGRPRPNPMMGGGSGGNMPPPSPVNTGGGFGSGMLPPPLPMDSPPMSFPPMGMRLPPQPQGPPQDMGLPPQETSPFGSMPPPPMFPPQRPEDPRARPGFGRGFGGGGRPGFTTNAGY